MNWPLRLASLACTIGLVCISLYHINECHRLESKLAASRDQTAAALKLAAEWQLEAEDAQATVKILNNHFINAIKQNQ